MAHCVDFKGTNLCLGPPRGMDETQVSTIHGFATKATVVTCWEPSPEEMQEIVMSGKIYLSVFMGGTMPPVFVGSESEIRLMTADYGLWKRD